jgi:hypothetical protein
VFGVQGGPKDFGGVSSSVGLTAIVAGADGAVSAPLALSSSSTASDPAVAVAANRPVVAWLDGGSSGSATSTVWVWDAWSATAPIVQVATGAYGAAPAVATDDRADALLTWVDAASKEVMASSSVGGGAFGAPTAVSADVTLSSPVATMDSQGTATIAWQPEQPTTSLGTQDVDLELGKGMHGVGARVLVMDADLVDGAAYAHSARHVGVSVVACEDGLETAGHERFSQGGGAPLA